MAYFETTDGIPLYYEQKGSGDTILLIHGWTMNAEYWWQKNLDSLAETHEVVALDLRGHGLSGKTASGHTLEQYARDVRQLIDSLGLSEVTPVGWSMGTAVIQNYVRQFGTEKLASAVFVDQSPMFFTEEGWDYPLMGDFDGVALAELIQNFRYNRERAAKPFIRAMFADPPEDDVVDDMYAETMKTPTDVAVSAVGDMSYQDLRPVLSDVDVPVLLLYGEQSAIFPGDLGAWLASELPEAEHVPFEESGHCPFWEEPEKFNEQIAAFVG